MRVRDIVGWKTSEKYEKKGWIEWKKASGLRDSQKRFNSRLCFCMLMLQTIDSDSNTPPPPDEA